MVTVLNNTTPGAIERSTTVERSTSDDSAGWAVAVIILLAVVAIAGFMWLRYYRAPAVAPASTSGGTNINVTLPSAPSNSDTGGNTTGGAGPSGAVPGAAQ